METKGVTCKIPLDLHNRISEEIRETESTMSKFIEMVIREPVSYTHLDVYKRQDEWIVDEPAAKIVRKIFDLCVAGLGPTQIAKRLKAAKVLTPTEYWNSIGRKCSKPPAIPYGWVADTVSGILDKQEYCGDTVNFRTYRKSFKMKKKLDKPKDEWKIFQNTHPAIIDRETFELVQEPVSYTHLFFRG